LKASSADSSHAGVEPRGGSGLIGSVRDFVARHRRAFLYGLSAATVLVSYLLWYNFRSPPINSNIGFDLYPLRQVGLSTSPFNPYLWPGSYVPWTLGSPIEMYYGSFFAVSGGSYSFGLFGSVVLLDAAGAVCLFYLAARWLARFAVREEYALFSVLIYAFNDYRLLNGFGTTDGYLSAGILPDGDPALLILLTFLTYLSLFRGRRYLLVLGAVSFFAFSNFPTASLTLLQEYAVVLAVLLGYRWASLGPGGRPRRLARLAKEAILLVGILIAANAYLVYPLALVLGSYLSSLGAATPAYTFSYGFDSSQTVQNAVRLATNWAVFSPKSPPWAVTYLVSPVPIVLSYALPVLGFAALLFLRRLSDVVIYALMVAAALLSASINTPLGPGFVWATTNLAPFRAFYYGATFSPILLLFYCLFAPVSIALLPGLLRPTAVSENATDATAGPPDRGPPASRSTSRSRRPLRYAWPTFVVVLLIASTYPALTPEFSQAHAPGYPIDSSLPSYYPSAAQFLQSSDASGPTMVFPSVEPFDSNVVNGTTWYSGVDLYPDLIPNPSVSSAYPSNYHGEDGSNLPVAGFVYDMGGAICASVNCARGGVSPIPELSSLAANQSTDLSTQNSSVVAWRAGFATDNVSFVAADGATNVLFRVNSSVVAANGHWLLGFLPAAENLSAYEFASVNFSLSGTNTSSVEFGFHSFEPYGPGNAYALSNYSVLAGGSSETVLIPLAFPTLRVGGSLDNVTNLFFVDDSTSTSSPVTLEIHSLRLLHGDPYVAPVWTAGTREDAVSLSAQPSGIALSFRIDRSVYEPNGHWALGYYSAPTNLSSFDYVVLNYTLSGIDAAYLQFGFHSGVNYGPGSGYSVTSYLTFHNGDRYEALIPLVAPTLSTGARLVNVTNLFLTYTPPAAEPGLGYVNLTSLRLSHSDPDGGAVLAGALARLGIEFAYVDTSVAVTNYVGYLGNYYNVVLGSSPAFDQIFHEGTVTIYRNLLYSGTVGSPSTATSLVPTNTTLGPLTFSLTNVYYNASNLGLAYVPPPVAEALAGYRAAEVASVVERSATEYTLHVTAPTTSILELRLQYSGDWSARFPNGTALPDHFTVDGFANGWLLPPGSYDLVLSIPWAPAYAAIEIAAFAVPPAFVAVFALLWYRHRRDGRHRPSDGAAPARAEGPDPSQGE